MSEDFDDFEYIECVNHINCGDYAMEGSDYCETCCQELQSYEIENLKEQRHQLLAKLGAIGALMKEQRYDEALALLPPNCEQVVREIQAEAVSNIKFDTRDAIVVLEQSGDGSFGSDDVEQMRFELAFISDVILANKANQLRNPEQEKV